MKQKKTGPSDDRPAGWLRPILMLVFLVYLTAVLWYTVGRREAGFYPDEYELFWSYKLWLAGHWEYGYAILANIGMFVPFGFLLAAWRNGPGWKTVLLILFSSLAFSCLIEGLQYELLRGCFEYDDMINNVAGALLGAAAFCRFRRALPARSLRMLMAGAGAGILLACLGIYHLSGGTQSGSMKAISQGLCFRAGSAAMEEGRLEVSGVCFWYDQGPEEYTVVLRSTRTGQQYPLKTERGLSRPEVGEYFHLNDVNVGFQAVGQDIPADEEYEFVLDFGFLRSVSVGVYLTVGRAETGEEPPTVAVSFVPGSAFRPLAADGTDLAGIVRDGVLLACDPANRVYIYSYQGSLYWVADEGFCFEDDGSTRLEVYLWTTQTDLLSEESRASGRSYDTIGVYFEKNELRGDFGQYRVCAWELPSCYPITSIRTGYYADDWVWREDIWPAFALSR